MKNYKTYEGDLPTLEVVQSGGIYQIMFNFKDVEHSEEEGEASEDKHCQCDLVEVKTLDYPTIVSAIIRAKYTQDDVEAILSNYQLCKDDEALEKCSEHTNRYNEYQEYRTTAKSIAKGVLK